MAAKPDPEMLLKKLMQEQLDAAEPEKHVMLNASAGTGKTQVLSARVLRLLLDGVAPEAILCITFTKAGAAEMAHRVQDRLAKWVQMDAGMLRLDLLAIGARHEDERVQARARTLFAQVVDAPGGGIRILTIHSFCQSLLGSFPVEAGLLPGFRLIDDGEADALRRAVFAEMVADPVGGGFSLALEALARRLNEQAVFGFLRRCVAAHSAGVTAAPDRAAVRAALNLPQGDADAWLVATGTRLIDPRDVADVADVAEAWVKSKNWPGHAATLRAWMAADTSQRAALLGDIRPLFLTGKGLPLAVYGKPGKEMGDAAVPAARVMSALTIIDETVIAMRTADELADAWMVGLDFAARYAATKRARGLAEFDDLIRDAEHLLHGGDASQWIQFKLDQKIDHLLVDEAQDTNKRQWEIVWGLVAEYFAGAGARENRLRTLFTVGDRKQAIFGFQGTDPAAFADWQNFVVARAKDAGQDIDPIDLAANFRSAPAILKLVDAWLDRVGPKLLGIDQPVARHIASVKEAGRIELWPPVRAAASDATEEPGVDDGSGDEGDDDGFGSAEDGGKGSDSASSAGPATDSGSMRVAARIASQIGDWIDHGFDGNPVGPGDIMVLVRSRRALAERIVAKLQSAGIAVAGVDRFALATPLAVRDLVAAMRFALQPLDDLNLAALLVSPLVRWSQEELLARGFREPGVRLWPHLNSQPALAAALDPLWALLRMADLTTPHVFLETILSGPLRGRAHLIGRLGAEARDPIDELVQAALDFETRELPTLAGFVAWFDSGLVEIKRQTSSHGGLVRVMTVHGSKGLQAKIVILADAAAKMPESRGGGSIAVPDHGTLPLLPFRKDERQGAIAEAFDEQAKFDAAEHWRLLYVALTRAERALILTGALGAKATELPADCWYRAVEETLDTMEGVRTVENRRLGPIRVYESGGCKWQAKSVPIAAVPSIPGWARKDAPAEARPPRPLAPSRIGVDDAGDAPPDPARLAAAERGRLMHALFERLPEIAPDARTAAARRWLGRHAATWDADAREAMVAEVMAVIDNPAHAMLFAPGALAEVPLTAVVDKLVISGTVDRLHISHDLVHVVDFKTGLFVPRDAAAVAPAYLRQMAAYAAALEQIFPGRAVAASLLYTAGPRLITLDAALLAAHKPVYVPPNKS